MNVPFEEWVAGGARFLVVDASDHVPDRRAFAAAHCGDDGGIATRDAAVESTVDPMESNGDVETDNGAVETDADAVETDDPMETDGGAMGAGEAANDGAAGETADAVLFLALDPAPKPPRVVATVVGPHGRRPVTGAAARVAAAWTARRTGAEAAMVDTPRGTRRAEVADSPDGWSVTATDPRTGVDSRRPVRRTGSGSLATVGPRPVE